MSSNWQRVRLVFHAALELPAEARAEYLARACEGEEDTSREVESLLAAHGVADGFLERPPLETAREAGAPPALQPGDRVGNFEVIGSLGTGGMGEVYRARDAELRREVAIKLLPHAVADDPQRLARFERESRILAALNHPHIATIHSIEKTHHLHALVMELVAGPTLDERLKRGPLPWSEALTVARELAAALEAAHEKGVVHRDLKPANIRFMASGSLKLLDFGLAKEAAQHEPPVVSDAAAPTNVLSTTDGLILGTCAYMSPEQARGLAVDRRTDVWAFGCLLYEMLAGKRAFAGTSAGDIIAAVLEREPDWKALPDAMPHSIRRLLRRCLEKDPHRRLHDVADARIEIDDAMQADDPETRVLERRRARNRTLLLASIVAIGAGSLATGWWLRAATIQQESTPRVMRSTWHLPAGAALNSAPVVSPEGRHIAFTASAEGQETRLWIRPVSALDAHAIPGTEGAAHPFWSPNGETLGYFAGGRLMKVAIGGGAPVEIAGARGGRGGTWSRHGVIVFSPDLIDSGLLQVSADGGAVQPATLIDGSHGENSHRWPVFLPDGVHFVYFVRSTRAERRGVYVGRVDRPAATPGLPLFRSESEAHYAPLHDGGGVFLTAVNGHLEVRSFDPRRLTLTGDPRIIDIAASPLTPYHPSMFTASADALTYVSAQVPFGQRFASVGRDGAGPTVGNERRILNWPRLSPHGSHIAYQDLDGTAGSPDLWVEDLNRGPRLRLTKGNAGGLPVWSPDGARIAYVTGAVSKPTLVIAAADGTGPTLTVPCPGVRCFPGDWSPNGRWLLVTVHFGTGVDVWLLPANGREGARPLLAESFVERDPRFSPDGDLVAYVSEESGAPEVSIQRIDGAPGRDVISVGGGDQPVWGRDGRELFFVDPQGMLRSVSARRGPDLRPVFGKPTLMDVPRIGFGHFGTQYDVSPDRQRIYFFDRRLAPPPSEIGLVHGWAALAN